VTLFNVANSTVAGPKHLTVWTSADLSKVSVPFTLVGPTAVSAPSVALSSRAAGTSSVNYVFRFKTGPNGALPGSSSDSAAPGTITLAAAPGIVFPNCFGIHCGYYPAYWLTYGSGKAAPCSAANHGCPAAGFDDLTSDGSVVTVASYQPIPASTAVALSVADVVSSATPGPGTILISTSSEPLAAPVTFSLAPASSVLRPSLQLSTVAAGASSVVYQLSFTTGPRGSLVSYVEGQKTTGFESSPQTITVQATPGTVFYPSYLVDGRTALPGSISGGGSVVSFGTPAEIGPSSRVGITLTGVAQAPTPGPKSLLLWTSSDSVPVEIPYRLAPPEPVDSPTIRLSRALSGATASYTLTMRTSANGGLHASLPGAAAGLAQVGALTIEAPPGTRFPSNDSDYLVNGKTAAYAFVSAEGSAVTLAIPANQAPSSKVVFEANSVVNAPEPGPQTLSLWTTSDTTTRQLAYRLSAAGGTTPSARAKPSASHPRKVAIHTVRRSVLATLPTPATSFRSLKHDFANAAITVGALLFITFPSQLFNSTFEENYEDIRTWWERKVRPLSRLRQRLAARHGSRREVGVFAAVLVAGALLGNFINPHFGFDLSSLASFLAIIGALATGICISFGVNMAYRRKRHGRDHLAFHFQAIPAGLAIAAVCVIVSRLADFAPGYLYGLVCGIAFARPLEKDEKGHVVAISTVATMVVATLVWFAWVPVNQSLANGRGSFAEVLLDDLLGSLFVSGLVGAVISMLPLRFLPGGDLAAWHRGVWAAVFGIAVFGMLQAMLRPESHSKVGHAPLVTVIVLFVIFGGGSVLFRQHFARRKRREAEAESSRDGAQALQSEERTEAAETEPVAPTEPVAAGEQGEL
jgi:hypothetical protein